VKCTRRNSRLPGLLPKAVERGELLDGDGVCHLQPEHEVVRRLKDHALEVLLAGKGVVGSIDADGLEDLGVFREAVPLEPSLGKLVPVFVAGAVVEHPAPAHFSGVRVDLADNCRQGVTGPLSDHRAGWAAERW
jgi:hypothetical protein